MPFLHSNGRAEYEKIDVDRDFLGAGAGSVLSGLFGAFPVNASPPRTGIVAETGGQSQLAGLAAAAIVLALLAFGTGLLRHVPDAALGGILLFVALRIIRVKQITTIYRQSFSEFLLIVATAELIIVLPIQQGAFLGIVLSLLHGIWSTTRTHVVLFERVPGTTIWWPAHPHSKGETVDPVVVAGFQAPLSFLNAATFRAEGKTVVLAAGDTFRAAAIEQLRVWSRRTASDLVTALTGDQSGSQE